MTVLLWLAAALLVTLFGLPLWRLEAVRRLDAPARIAVAFMGGNAIAAAILYLEALAGLRWNVAAIAIPLGLCAASGFIGMTKSSSPRESPSGDRTGAFLLLMVLILAAYGTVTARLTSADLLYFWGPKAQQFSKARTIDFTFLGRPENYYMHADYPPLQPIVNAIPAIAAGEFSFWGALLLTPIHLAAAALVLRGFAAPVVGASRANAFAALLAAVLTLGFASGRAAGGGDPLLLLFEVTALAALVFGNDGSSELVAAVALAGAAFAKVEGAAFAAVICIILLIARRVRSAAIVTAPAAMLLGSWILITRMRGLVDSYVAPARGLHLETLPVTLSVTASTASYSVYYLPWIAALAPLPFGTNFRRALIPLAAGAGAIGCAIFFYLHEADPVLWIRSSAERVLLTALACFVVASAASSEYSPESDGLVP